MNCYGNHRCGCRPQDEELLDLLRQAKRHIDPNVGDDKRRDQASALRQEISRRTE